MLRSLLSQKNKQGTSMKQAAFFFLLTGLFAFTTANAQKYEREERISPEELPAAVLLYLNEQYPQRSKVRHYRELSRSGAQDKLQLFFESKFRHEGWYYSVKFDSLGQLYDTERILPRRQLSEKLRDRISKDLSQFFSRYRLRKIQQRPEEDGTVTGYEIVVRGKHDKAVSYYEFQYSANGERQSQELIEQAPNPFFFF
jgi:hypothetical protein